MRELERARWRCRRGLLELDVILQRFVDEHYARLDEAELRQFETLLNLSDSDLWDMIVQKEADDESSQSVLRLLRTVRQ
ncbi:succinate dehydrogenase assembly factor 2 [Nitrosovibrio tenuis]|uniref:FAD assembly factor SdhE n=1 Tax=Nitrosovibrio tenuis TaxID=1233 RepID=A0A1H7KAU2_9PROT|nr:succinate dehydrogenase assembly factor 2 [Nitrosovibrio tenuis]SEK83087.1 antitoxin CptB [Nitrosovibrio tenuis]